MSKQDITKATLDRELFAVYKAKALAYDCLETDGSSIEIKDTAGFVHRSSVAHIMAERHKNRNNMLIGR